ncbi:MAG: DUF1285 domain-containing protein [Candidatus Rokubacteria bacterium]|nr:DUF1285 domain-containing protein [Candidatus Rokubacteria bacterium]
MSAPERSTGDWKLPDLSIDADGEWYDDGVQITHPGIVANLRGNLRRDDHGYFIQTRVRIPVAVADVPWVVVRLERRGQTLHAILNDGTEAAIDPATLRIGPGNIPYATVKEGRFEARLSRPATFQLLALAEEDGATGEVLRLGERAWPLRRPTMNESGGRGAPRLCRVRPRTPRGAPGAGPGEHEGGVSPPRTSVGGIDSPPMNES